MNFFDSKNKELLPVSFLITSNSDLIQLEKHIRAVLGCATPYCSFLHSAEYISFKHEISRWLFLNKKNDKSLDYFPRNSIHIHNSRFVIFQSIVSSDNMYMIEDSSLNLLSLKPDPTLLSSFTCFVSIQDTSGPAMEFNTSDPWVPEEEDDESDEVPKNDLSRKKCIDDMSKLTTTNTAIKKRKIRS